MATKAEKYYRKGQKSIDESIEDSLEGSNEVVYGARAVNRQLPKYLNVYTEDWDIATVDDPEKEAKRVEKQLDHDFGGNYFRIVPAIHPGTFKVISNVTNKGVADLTRIEEPIEYRKLGRIRYATLNHQLQQIDKSLKDPESQFRWNKDKNAKQRIKIGMKRRRKKQKVKTLVPRAKLIK